MKKQTLFSKVLQPVFLLAMGCAIMIACTEPPQPVERVSNTVWEEQTQSHGSQGTLIPSRDQINNDSRVYTFGGHDFQKFPEKMIQLNWEGHVNLEDMEFYLVYNNNQKNEFHKIPGVGANGYSLYDISMLTNNTFENKTQIGIRLEVGPGEVYSGIRLVIRDHAASLN
ncbi:hypothetical protein [Pararhodonellum marinum]|uniref:hypothetical protein n=1 Tax=Pararhodonellum marinum TaxID=2755358 RepID=UPI00188E2E4D|nr:hypothetical protein [Pararhodonellum marinum]